MPLVFLIFRMYTYSCFIFRRGRLATAIFKQRINSLYILFIISIFSLTGCDQVSSFFQYFSKSEQPKIAQKQSQEQAPPSTPQPKVSTPTALPENVLAKVGKWTLTKEDFQERLASLKEVVPNIDVNDLNTKKLILEELIRQQLLVEDAQISGLANQKDIELAVEEFRRTLIVREVARQLTGDIQVTDGEVKEYYEQNKDRFIEPAQWKIREIVTYTQDGAKEILVELLKGADFAEMAKTRSVGKTAAQGGDLGYVTEIQNPQMEAALATLNVGDLSSIFKSSDGYSIIKLEEKKGGEPKKFEEIQEDIKAGLTLLEQQEVVGGHLQKLREKINVVVNEKILEE